MNFDEVFKQATGGKQAHPWQTELSQAPSPDNRLIRIPTGMGKTLGVLATWLHRRVIERDQSWPTRLVWCLPMRTLVEQTENEVDKLIKTLELPDDQVRSHVLMGGADEARWYDKPETPAILIGTQDMLLSRALNRGYAMFRAAWPRAFGLLNTDALWVMDEVQLMGVGLATSAQIQAFSDSDLSSMVTTGKPRVTWWMSATLQPNWLETPETKALVGQMRGDVISVDASDRKGPTWDAKKSIERVVSEPDQWAKLIVSKHLEHEGSSETGRQSLVVVNSVKQARDLHSLVNKQLKGIDDAPELKLIHSRFRPAERETWLTSFLSRESLNTDVDRIMIATQVVEAGVDISASCLITELAPWPNLVQRFGRAARYGGHASIVVLDQEHEDIKKALPYELEQLAAAREAIDLVDDVSISQLEEFEASLTPDQLGRLYPYSPRHVLLRHEFEELFDTSPDLSGAEMDISRFIRDGDDTKDVQIFWRSWADDRPQSDLQAQHRELCAVPIGEAKDWVKKMDNRKDRLFQWDYLVGEWTAVDEGDLRPGMILLADPSVGGYDEEIGFTGAKPKKNERVTEAYAPPVTGAFAQCDSTENSEANSQMDVWKTIATHGRDAMQVGQSITSAISLGPDLSRIVSLALRLHDWGKAHPSFASGTYFVDPERTDLAKAPRDVWRSKHVLYKTDSHGHRRGFRHELASCLAVLELLRGANPMHPAILGEYYDTLVACEMQPDIEPASWADNTIANEISALDQANFNLLLYLIASHHGKVRVSLQASPFDQEFPAESGFVGQGFPIRGVREGDEIPATLLPLLEGEEEMPAVPLSLTPAAMGLSERYGASWSERIESLVSNFGPFTLGYLEAIIRAADGRASDTARAPGKDADPLLRDIALAKATPQESTREAAPKDLEAANV